MNRLKRLILKAFRWRSTMTRRPETASSGDPAAVLAAFHRTLAWEMHLLRRDPELLWQQLFNRLQWEDEPVPALLVPEFERRSLPEAAPWLRTRTRFRQSEALVRTLEGHTDGVTACAFSPDGARVVSASSDKTLKLWDSKTGGCLATLPLLGGASAAAHHPHRASVAFGDNGGSVYLIDLIGIAIGSPRGHRRGPWEWSGPHCPVCLERHPLQEDWLGRELDRPGSACTARLRVNPFIAGRRVHGRARCNIVRD